MNARLDPLETPSVDGNALSPAPSPTVWQRVREQAADYWALTKPGIWMLMLVATAATMLAAAKFSLSLQVFLLTLLGTAMAAAGANTLNCYVDRDIDAIMERTRHRPLPAGRLQPRQALLFGIALLVGSWLVLALGVNLWAAAAALGGALFYVFIYTLWLKRSTPQNIVIGGAAGAVPPLIGWAAATGHYSWIALGLFGVIFLWTPPHFWALALYRNEDYRRAGIPMMPTVAGVESTKRQMLFYTVALVILSISLYWVGLGSWVYLLGATALGLYYIYLMVKAQKDHSVAMAKRLFRYSIQYLGLFYILIALG